MKQWANTIAGSVLLLFSITLYFLIPYQIGIIETEKAHMAPSFYPKLVIISLAVIALIYLIVSIVEESRQKPASQEQKTDGKEDEHLPDKGLVRALITIAITLIYVYIFEFLGFFVATPLLLGAMMFHMGNRRVLTFCLIMIFTPLIMYIIFERVMLIILPKGIFF